MKAILKTEKLCKTNPVLLKAWKDSSSKQKLILENEEISAEKNNSVNKADEPSQSVDSTNDDKKHVGESELRALLENATDETILYFICDDFDDDGTKEAFAATSENDADAEELLNGILDCISPYKIWFYIRNIGIYICIATWMASLEIFRL